MAIQEHKSALKQVQAMPASTTSSEPAAADNNVAVGAAGAGRQLLAWTAGIIIDTTTDTLAENMVDTIIDTVVRTDISNIQFELSIQHRHIADSFRHNR